MLFRSKAEKELDGILFELRSYLANNYKDAAHEKRKLLGRRVNELYEAGAISVKRREKYLRIYEEYTEKMKDYHH